MTKRMPTVGDAGDDGAPSVAEIEAMTQDELVALRAHALVGLERAERACRSDGAVDTGAMLRRVGKRLAARRLLHALDERFGTLDDLRVSSPRPAP